MSLLNKRKKELEQVKTKIKQLQAKRRFLYDYIRITEARKNKK